MIKIIDVIRKINPSAEVTVGENNIDQIVDK